MDTTEPNTSAISTPIPMADIPQDRYGVPGYSEGESARDTMPQGSGQTGSGTVTALPAARSHLHEENPALAEAAIKANQQPAPSDPVLQQLAALTSRVETLEKSYETLADAHNTLIGQVSTRTNVEADVAALVKAAEAAEPFIARLKHLFEVHWAGKFPSL